MRLKDVSDIPWLPFEVLTIFFLHTPSVHKNVMTSHAHHIFFVVPFYNL